jgi:hypothetical protein
MIAREDRYILKYIVNFNKNYNYLLLYLVNLEICLRRKGGRSGDNRPSLVRDPAVLAERWY